MSLESFYGGKQGVSPIVKARFKYVDTEDQAYKAKVNSGAVVDSKDVMELCFANPSYTDVWYGQLAIIDTTNKSNKNNGKLFRRVLTRANKEIADGGTPHGEYIGRIVGPSEGFPKVWLGSLEEMSNKAKAAYQENSNNHYVFPKSKNENGGAGDVFDGEGGNLASKEESLSLKTSSPDKGMIETLEGNKTNNQLIPGVKITTDEEGNKNYKYETGIHYSWVNIRNDIDDNKEDTYVYLGFQIPYTVIDLNFSGGDWTEPFSSDQTNKDEYLDGRQPFYQKWAIKIPRGVKGNGVGFLRQAKFNDFKNADPNNSKKEILYRYNDIYNANDGTFTLPEDTGNYRQAFEFDAELNNEASILVYTIYGYDINYGSENSYQKTATCYFGKINDISSINLAENGTLTVYYSSGKNVSFNNKIKWIKNIEMIDASKDSFTTQSSIKITYNDGNSQTLGPLKLVDDLMIFTDVSKQNRYPMIKYSNSDSYQNILGSGVTPSFNQIDGLRIKTDTKEMQYHTNPINALLPGDEGNYRSFSNPVILDIIEEAFINGEGHLLIKHSSSEIRYNGDYDDSQSYQPYTRYHYYDEKKNKHWYKGGDLPDATGGNDEHGVWWEDLGIVKQYVSGLRIGEEFNTERYNYYLEQIGESPIDWNTTNLSKSEMINILTNPWDINGVNISPYTDGHIKIYQTGQNKNINASILEDKIGQLVFYDGNAYYFDFGEKYYDSNNNVDNNLKGRRWKSAGSWSEAQESLQLKIKNGPIEEKWVPSTEIIPFFKNGMVFETDWANNKENKFELIKSWQ